MHDTKETQTESWSVLPRNAVTQVLDKPRRVSNPAMNWNHGFNNIPWGRHVCDGCRLVFSGTLQEPPP